MRNLLRVKLVVLALFFLYGCDDESLLQQQDFKQLVEKITEDDQTVPQESNLTNAVWSSNDWQINIYEGESKIGNWNNYSESMTQVEKSQTYRFADKKFIVGNTGQQAKSAAPNSFDYELNEKGELMINDILFMAKIKSQSLTLYYNTVDAGAVADIFKVTIDQTFGKSLQTEAGLLSLGIISLEGEQTGNNDSEELSSYELINKFQERQEMFAAVFNTLKVTDDAYTFLLTDEANSQSGKEQQVTIKDQTIDLSNITPERAKLLFEPFMKKQAFTFKGVDVMISKITHEDGSGNSFLVYGKTTANNEDVAFYYNTESGKEHWNQAPQSNSELSAYDLVNKFQERQEMFGAVFNTLKTTDDAYTFTLTDDANTQSGESKEVIIQNQTIDLSNITPERAKLLFEPFMKKQVFTFKGVDVMISKITHEDGSGNSFLVYGKTTANNEDVAFYYNTESGKEHWNQAPQSNSDLTAYDLVNKFQERQEMFGAVFNTLKTTEDAYTFTLTDDVNTQSGESQEVIIQNQTIDLSNITPERAKLLFEPFMKKQAFTFKGVDVMISKITHEDGSGNSFLVYGKTTANNEDVAFYYNTESGKEHWNQAPQSNSDLTAYDLVNKFQERQEMFGAVFNTLKTTEDAYTFTLTDDVNTQSGESKEVIIQNQTIDLSNITPERAKQLFEPFMKKQAFTFKGVDVMISKITHEDGSGNSFLVYGKTTANNEDVAFYYNTESGKEHWNQAPQQ